MGEKKGINPIAASLAGAAVGAVVAAGTIALSDKKNRKKVEKIFDEIKDEGMKILEKMQHEIKEVQKLAEPNAKPEPIKAKAKTRK